mmetsp:Transcript_1287/g.1826  ORF Transcript_1287/g.1826 Transcript_1287/m.1826 type:complete len:258 (+) Transcript_1287:1048-1821(+)|eukprot:CAMPEP_0167743660 /NCGR_PEP_ID=MMETSP0110_2-20121227/2138_1 /TAXON_ID=629695 /ORGANISM="Gymnochlora sp., Strain CCMP2014" /LENGTH=257 /DNA_ID=CAMNT_0007628053 /DNA_START=1027 /DNA_END=1800 /DNA_ORIENTATION=-
MSEGKPQTVYIFRHGDRMDRGIDKESRDWQKDNKRNEDTPISYIGRTQAEDVATYLLKEVDLKNTILISSPWLRTMQTSLPFTKKSKLKLRLDSAFGEGAAYRSHDAPPHAEDSDFKGLVDKDYKELLGGKDPDVDMKNVEVALEKRFGFKAGRSIVIFSHADPCIYMSGALSKKPSSDINVASPCALWKLTQSAAKKPYKVECNGRIDHLSVYGRTNPWHHNKKLVTAWRKLGWPPPEDEQKLKVFREAYHDLYKN